MCGRFSLTASAEALQAAFPQFSLPARYAPRFNIAPSQPVLGIANNSGGRAVFWQWGLVPGWSKDPTRGMINARAETLAEKPSFSGAYKYRRGLILADGFYEWQKAGKIKIPHYIGLASGEPFAFAALWETWRAPDGSEVDTCAIITTTPNSLMASLHERMPVILRPSDYDLWLDPAPQSDAALRHLFAPYPAQAMHAYPVSTLVNNPANDLPECKEKTECP
jgi:putative SOS response-associated peptidase YedK